MIDTPPEGSEFERWIDRTALRLRGVAKSFLTLVGWLAFLVLQAALLPERRGEAPEYSLYAPPVIRVANRVYLLATPFLLLYLGRASRVRLRVRFLVALLAFAALYLVYVLYPITPRSP